MLMWPLVKMSLTPLLDILNLLLLFKKRSSLLPPQRFYIFFFSSTWYTLPPAVSPAMSFPSFRPLFKYHPSQRSLPNFYCHFFILSPFYFPLYPLTIFICLHITYQYLKLFSNILEVHCLSPLLDC